MTRQSLQEKTALLKVENLHVEFDTYGGVVKAVRGVDFTVQAGKTLAIVGESGCGKSVSVHSIMGLIPMPPGRITKGTALLNGVDILGKKTIGDEDIRGSKVGMIFQDPMTSLNPTMTIGDQVAETLQVHRGFSHSRAFARAIELLELVKIPDAAQRAKQYPFEFSGGMLQRAMIAMAVACGPSLLIADEPTTALDVTVQAQVLHLLKEVTHETGAALVIITHDLGVVARYADRVNVMYAGRIVEAGPARKIYNNPKHPYTVGLMNSVPRLDGDLDSALEPIEGQPPDLGNLPSGCAFHPRCVHAVERCSVERPELITVEGEHVAACWVEINATL